MAKAKMTTIEFHEEYYTTNPDYAQLFITTATRSKTVCVDTASGHQIIFEGRNFKYEDGRINSGTITDLILADDEGTPLQSVSNLKLNVGIVSGTNMYDFASDAVAHVIFGNVKILGCSLDDSISGNRGNDRVLGRAGADSLEGGEGRDILTGGIGNDTFIFRIDQERDTITDFDADGGVGQQDFIQSTFPGGGSVSQSGSDTVIDFGNGDVFVLKNVDADHIDATDFVV